MTEHYREAEEYWGQIVRDAVATCPRLPPPLIVHEANEVWIMVHGKPVLKVTRAFGDAYSETASFIASMMCLLNEPVIGAEE